MEDYKKYKASNTANNNNNNGEGEEKLEDIDKVKKKIRDVKIDTLEETKKGVSRLRETEESAQQTMERLAAQGEKIDKIEEYNEDNLGQAEKANIQATELKRINKSMFSFLRNPFKKKADKKIDEVEAKNREKNQMLHEKNETEQRQRQENFSNLSNSKKDKNALLQPNSKYNFEEDEEGLQIEKEIDDNLDEMSAALDRLKDMSIGMGSELDRQNEKLKKVEDTTDKVTNKVIKGQKILNNVK